MNEKHKKYEKEFPRDTRRPFSCPSHSNEKKIHEDVETYIELNFLKLCSVLDHQYSR